MLLELLAAALLAGGDDKKKKLHQPNRKSYHEAFEEAGSFYDRNGDEHIIDDDNYCEDCDDYHDDF